jgi:predicted flap endonuclease-1-like 5' DNA nuclease
MLWLIGQIAVFLLIAVVLGLVIGWLLRTLWPSSRARAREGELQTALERATGRISDLEAGLRAKRAAATAAAEQEQAALRRVEQLQAALDDAHAEIEHAREEQDHLRSDVDAAEAQIDALRGRISDLEVQAATLAAVEAARDAARARAAALEAELADSASSQRPLFAVPDTGAESPRADADAEESGAPQAAGAEPGVAPVDAGTPTSPEAESDDGGEGASEPDLPNIVPLARPASPAGEPGTEATSEEASGEPPGPAPGDASVDEAGGETAEAEAARLEQERLDALAEAADRFHIEEPVESDDLREIYGVGPALERLLHSMNIYTFAQIANFTEDDVDLVSRALGRAFPDRVTRDDWIGSARGLHRQKYGEEPAAP